jgi:hypothetical protein
MNQLTAKIGLVAIIIALWAESVELSFVVAFAVLLLHFNARISRGLSQIVLLIMAMMAVGTLGIMTRQAGLYGFVKDVVYFLRPLTVMLATYYAVQRLKSKADFYNLIVLVGFGFALFHLLDIGIGLLRYRPNLQKFRELFGKLNHVEMVALFLIACIRDLPVKKTRYTLFYKLAVAVLIGSFLLYFSRTMIVVLVLMILAYYGYLKLNARGAFMGLILLAFGAGFAFFLSQYEPDETQPQTVLTGFLAKIKNSYTETFEPIKFDTYLKDRRSLWPRWRAYEANLVLTEVDRERKWLQGKGFGSTVDAGFELRLNGEMIQHLPTVHNGVAYVYMKTGILGLLLYFTIFLVLYSYNYRTPEDQSQKSYHRALVAAGFYMLAATMVVTGIFKPYMMVGFLIGGSFALKNKEA